jgi:hypothetical protein
MIGYVGVDEQVDRDFHRALMKASLRRWRDRLLRADASGLLPSFDDAKDALICRGQVYRGIRTVDVASIAGSVGRSRDFDGSFLPLRVSSCDRWSRVDRAYHQGVELPVVSLYKVGDSYFVKDGNHRVSVARYHGVAAIDAEVVEFRGHARADCPPATGLATAAAPATKPLRPEGGWTSPLHGLWRRLRPALIGTPARPTA